MNYYAGQTGASPRLCSIEDIWAALIVQNHFSKLVWSRSIRWTGTFSNAAQLKMSWSKSSEVRTRKRKYLSEHLSFIKATDKDLKSARAVRFHLNSSRASPVLLVSRSSAENFVLLQISAPLADRKYLSSLHSLIFSDYVRLKQKDIYLQSWVRSSSTRSFLFRTVHKRSGR